MRSVQPIGGETRLRELLECVADAAVNIANVLELAETKAMKSTCGGGKLKASYDLGNDDS